jgi:hypothetical protein
VLTGILEKCEQRQKQQDNNDPQREIPEISVHHYSSAGNPPAPDGLFLATNRGGLTSRTSPM